MNANEASLEAARLWLIGAQAVGIEVVLVGDRLYCSPGTPSAQTRALQKAMPEHRVALATLLADDDEDARFVRARAMFAGPETMEGGG